ncbi:tensin-4-like [Genypterus blacodes]|uniref:tensin-4-like n=1 Tax=Genypterus blacodes TaxID=154954 RepID=UPI003F76854F
MMLTAKGMSHMIPSHVLRVGQTIRLDSSPETVNQHPSFTDPSGNHSDPDLDISLDNLNQLILELDPTFEPIQTNTSPPCISSPTDDCCSDDDVPNCMLVPRGCPSPSVMPSLSPSIPIPTQRCSPHGSLAFSGSPTSSRPPLPCGSVLRQIPSPRNDKSSYGSMRMSLPNRNSTISLLSTSTGSDTSYMLGSSLSLASEDAESPESFFARTSGSFCNVPRIKLCDTNHSPDKPFLSKPTPLDHLQFLQSTGTHSSPASLAGSLTDIPVVLINGTPPSDRHMHQFYPPESDLTTPQSFHKPCSPHSFQAHFDGSQPSMKFVMDTSKFWFRPHTNRAEADALVKDQEPGSFVVRDSTSYRGSFGLVMKIHHVPNNLSGSGHPDESGSELIRHFLIESSPKGVRIKGSSHEPYFGSLSALVYQHTISEYALPCKLLLHCQDLDAGDERAKAKSTSENNSKTACNFLYLNAVHTEMLTGPCAVQKAVSSTFEKGSGTFKPTVVNLKASLKGVTLTDINRKLFFRRHYPAHLLSYSGEDPDKRLWIKGGGFAARMFGFVAKGVEAGMENVCHVFAEYDPLQPCSKAIESIQAAVSKP